MATATALAASPGYAPNASVQAEPALTIVEGDSGKTEDRHFCDVRPCETVGVSVCLLSTGRVVHALNTQLSCSWVTTRLVEQCITGYRDSLLLFREYGHRVEGERLHLWLQLRDCRDEHPDRDEHDRSVTRVVEQQLLEHLLQNGNVDVSIPSELPRYRQIIRDMNHLAHGLLIPIDILRLRHSWLLVQEDVQLTLADRLRHYRVVVRRPPPVSLVERLWFDLWGLLGAAWRQCERLLGFYADDLIPLSGDAFNAGLPPSVTSAPAHREAYREWQREYRARCVQDTAPHRVPVDAEDRYAFGPITPHRIGVMSTRHYTIRWPLMSILRSLRACVADRTSAGTAGDCKGVYREGCDMYASASTASGICSRVSCGSACGGPAGCNTTFFDPSSEDMEMYRVPYVSPECFVHWLRNTERKSKDRTDVFISHRFSDDAWNVAVLTIEFMLADFPLEQSCCRHADYSAFRTNSLFDDLIELLVVYHNIPLGAARNFVYAALHELSLLLSGHELSLVGAGEDGAPTPQRLAQQWQHYLSENYSGSAVLREVSGNGLQWARRQRWEAFHAAHSVDEHDEVGSGNRSSSSDVCADKGDANTGDCAAGRVLDSLVIPFMPLNTVLCSAAINSDGEASEDSQSATSLMRRWCQSEGALRQTPFEGLQLMMQKWKRSIERYTILGGLGGRGHEAKQTVLFKRFVRVVRSIVQLQLDGSKNDTAASSQSRSSLAIVTDGEFSAAERQEGLSHAVQQELLRGLTERGALFMHVIDLLSTEDVPGSLFVGGDTRPRVVSLPRVFMSVPHIISLLEGDMAQLTELSPGSTASFNALDAIVGAGHGGGRQSHLATFRLAEKTAGLNVAADVRSVIRQLDLNLNAQVALVQDIRRVMLSNAPVETRATLLRQYLLGAQAKQGSVEIPIPATIRGEVWSTLLLVPPNPSERVMRYFTLDTARPTPYNRQLAVDIPRCHQYHPLLASSDGHDRMWRVIKAWLLLNPGLSYWQGLDSVCAILLSVSFHDEPLVLAQLQVLTHNYIPHDLASRETSRPESMVGRFQLLAVFLRYCDPYFAHHLFDKVGCGPELFAVSWFLSLFAHGQPMGKVFLLWDFLFVHAATFPHCLTILCLAALLQHREQMMSNDFSVCLSTLSRARDINIQSVLRGASLLLQSTPPIVGGPFDCSCQPHSSGNSVARMRVETLLRAYRRSAFGETPHGDEWTRNGLFLVDLRETRGTTNDREREGQEKTRVKHRESERRVIGALLFPLVPCPLGGKEFDAAEQGLQDRLAVQLASELLSQTRNIVLAAVPPAPSSSLGVGTTATCDENDPTCVAQVDVIATQLKSPHIVLFTHSSNPCEVSTSELLARELMRCGAPHVSLLLGGFVQLSREAPDLIVEVVSV